MRCASRVTVGQKLLFIEGLRIVQYLLGRVAQQPVPIPLQGGEVIQTGRLRGFLLSLHAADNGSLALTGGAELFRRLSLFHTR